VEGAFANLVGEGTAFDETPEAFVAPVIGRVGRWPGGP
jgi:hypothetical protein